MRVSTWAEADCIGASGAVPTDSLSSELYARRLVEEGLARLGIWRGLDVVDGVLSWIASRRTKLTDLDEHTVERYLRYRGSRQTIQPGDRAALRRWLSVLRNAGTIAPAPSRTVRTTRYSLSSPATCEESAVSRRSPFVRHLAAIQEKRVPVGTNGEYRATRSASSRRDQGSSDACTSRPRGYRSKRRSGDRDNTARRGRVPGAPPSSRSCGSGPCNGWAAPGGIARTRSSLAKGA